MIGISDIFSMVGCDGCIDVASSLALQGADGCIGIPIYDVFMLQILPGDSTASISESISEFNAIRELSECCGAISAKINILGIDILTLMGILAVSTPYTGMHVFVKLGDILVEQVPLELIAEVANSVGIPIPSGAVNLLGFAQDLIKSLLDTIIEKITDNLDVYGIQLHEWSDLPAYYNQVKGSGEMEEMMYYRQSTNAALF